MNTIEGYPEASMHGQFLMWGRSDSYAPALLPSDSSTEALRAVQSDIQNLDPNAQLTQKLHATILFCPPKHLFEAVKAHTGVQYSVQNETLFYMDVAASVSTHALFPPKAEPAEVEALECFDDKNGIIALRLAQTAFLSQWRQSVRELMYYNLREHHGVNDAIIDSFSDDPKLRWLFASSEHHVTLATNAALNEADVASIPVPEYIELTGISSKSPADFLGSRSLLFDPDAAFNEA